MSNVQTKISFLLNMPINPPPIDDYEAQRARFEKWISSPPYEHSVSLIPNNPEEFAWPGQYVDIRVQLAWEAWSESIKQASGQTRQN